ncbi:dienelactone hydrolase family protein [Streptomyces harbinensis]|uniref:dienelactone hydrolase family protein n=1 Tax=Streptomyces harbinensis TaxID=1176198 RepID=UPI00371FC45D
MRQHRPSRSYGPGVPTARRRYFSPCMGALPHSKIAAVTALQNPRAAVGSPGCRRRRAGRRRPPGRSAPGYGGPVTASLTNAAVPTPDAVRRDAGACLDWLAASPLTTGGPVAVTGYCFGAGLALRTAGGFPDRVAAVAGFHGGRLATEAEDSPHRLAGRITAEVYFGHADQDASLPPEQIDRLDTALARAGVRYRTEVYRGARHGFTQADTVAYDPAADARHWRALLGLLDRTFPGRGIDGDGAR